ncbi:hypothetical protein [Tolumonas osonensis]|uniref:RcnB family protein n=1 Tax=Tolumonas osonensis TaxID=675874 RepID=A0A841GBZ2_9GAMM|nr:hypothetical protein [Tolumonas osonensis]MBB6055127.1 hypothetical protein [Tolumonas osonensis]
MKYRRIISLFMVAALLPLAQAQARPHFDGDDDHRWEHRKHHHRDYGRVYYPGPVRVYPAPVHVHAPARYTIMPPGYKTVIAAGVTYFVLNELWYRMHGGAYEQVAAPATSNVTIINNGATTTTIANTGSVMNVVDVNGTRYYVQNGRYYRHTPDGQYLEVAPPNY